MLTSVFCFPCCFLLFYSLLQLLLYVRVTVAPKMLIVASEEGGGTCSLPVGDNAMVDGKERAAAYLIPLYLYPSSLPSLLLCKLQYSFLEIHRLCPLYVSSKIE